MSLCPRIRCQRHSCHTDADPEKWEKTKERDQAIRDAGYNLVTITSCEWIKNPESRKKNYRLEPEEEEVVDIQAREAQIIQDIQDEKIFGFVKCDVRVPDHLISKFSEFPPVFKNTEIKLEDVGETMQAYCDNIGRTTGVKRSLISSMHGEGIILLTPLLKWYLDNDIIIENIEFVVSYNAKNCFQWFMDEVTDKRRGADLGGPGLKMVGETAKLSGNSSYGGVLMDKTKHTATTFTKEKNLEKHVRNPFLKDYDELNEEIYEVTKQKSKIVHDLPLQIGLAVYSYAKLRMLEFWHFINEYLDNDLYQFMEMDTDSLYIAFARDTVDECVKPELREKWESVKYDWFCSEDSTTMVPFRDTHVSLKQFDQRTPGKFKLEYSGTGMACLNSKTYIIWGALDKDGKPAPKCSSKGVQEKRNPLTEEDFHNIILTQQPKIVTNAGFVKDKNHVINTYTQQKQGMSFFYAKRKVLPDFVSTTHLDI